DTSWESVANDALPPAFANIQDYLRAPEVMTHIAGTPQAQDALLDNSLPRTSKINLDSADFSPVWDGGPRFEPVSGKPELQYGLNTPNAIFKYEGIFYGCEQGVWYTSESLRGHWQIARYIPDIIYDIPVSNPHYNVTYVHIYETTPHAVYVGYTPGYLGSYIYRGSIVHGTGWHYRPWHKRHYYARPPTWGLNAHYDPFYGWGFSTALFRHYSRHGSHHRDNHYYANRQHTYWPNNTHYRIHRRYHNKVHSNGFGLHGYKQHYRRTAFRRDKAHPKQHNFRKNEHPARPASRLYTDGNKVFGPRANLSHREKAKNRPRSGRRSHNQQRAIQAIDTSPNYVVRNRGSHNKYRNNNNAINSIPQQRINRSQREKNTRQMQKQRQVRLVNNKHKQPSSRKNRHNTPTKIRSMAASQKHSSGHQQRIVARQKNQASPDIQPTRKIQRREQRKATDQSRTANHKTNNKLTAHKRSNNKQNARTKHMDSRRH
ncbi:MAG: hypothetical protein KUG75_15995, partial [Pseudomonadales bacterium]|nr:hypothetical protein [Pseudomonadales bacterium]